MRGNSCTCQSNTQKPQWLIYWPDQHPLLSYCHNSNLLDQCMNQFLDLCSINHSPAMSLQVAMLLDWLIRYFLQLLSLDTNMLTMGNTYYSQKKFDISIYFHRNLKAAELQMVEKELKNSSPFKLQKKLGKELTNLDIINSIKACKATKVKKHQQLQDFQGIKILLFVKTSKNMFISLNILISFFFLQNLQDILNFVSKKSIKWEIQDEVQTGLPKTFKVSFGLSSLAQSLKDIICYKGQASVKICKYHLVNPPNSLLLEFTSLQQLSNEFMEKNDEHTQRMIYFQLYCQNSVKALIQNNSVRRAREIFENSQQTGQKLLQFKPIQSEFLLSLNKQKQGEYGLQICLDQDQQMSNPFSTQKNSGQFLYKPASHNQNDLSTYLQKISKNCPFITFLSQTINQRQIFKFSLYNLIYSDQVLSLENETALAFFYKVHQYYLHKYPELYDIFQREFDPLLTKISKLLNFQRFDGIFEKLVEKQRGRNRRVNQQYIKNQILVQLEKDLKIQKQNLIDRLLCQLCKKYKEKSFNNRKLSIKIKIKNQNPITLQQYFSRLDDFYTETSVYQNIIAKIKKFFQPLNQSQHLKKTKEIMANLQSEVVQSADCVGCAQFFYLDFNLRDDTVNRTPILVVDYKSQDRKNQLTQAICALLNSNGGIVLLNCQASELGIYPVGIHIQKNQKNQQIQQIAEMLRSIQPQPEMNKNIIVQFVPLKKMELSSDKNELEMSRESEGHYLLGRYVCRIKVRPTRTHQKYILIHESQCKLLVLEKYQIKQILPRSFRKYLKKMWRRFQKCQEQLTLSCQNKQPILSNFDHEKCSQPEKEIPMIRNFDPIKTIKKSYEFQQRFDEMNLIIVKQKYLSEIKKKLFQKGIECQIEIAFSKYKFGSSKYTAVLYSNMPYDQLIKTISFNREFEFDRKVLLVLKITDYIKLQNRTQQSILSEQQYINIKNWLHSQFPNEHLRIWEFDLGTDKQYYAETQSKISTLFLYYVMNNFNEKASFKNPKNLQKLSMNDWNQKWKMIQGQEQLRDENQLQKTLLLYLLGKLRECFKKYKETNRLLRMQNTLLKYLEFILKKNLDQFERQLISQCKVSTERAEDIIQRLIELPEVMEFINRQNLLIYLQYKIKGFVPDKLFKKDEVQLLLSSLVEQKLSIDSFIQKIQEKGLEKNIQKTEIARGKASIIRFFEKQKPYILKYLGQKQQIL